MKVSPNHWLPDKAHHAGFFPLACPLFSQAEADSGSRHFPTAACLLLYLCVGKHLQQLLPGPLVFSGNFTIP